MVKKKSRDINMKLLKEIIIIFGIYYIGETCRVLLHIPIPGSLIGMLLLVLALHFKIVKLGQISTISNFLLGHLSFFFIPAGVALMAVFPQIANNWYWILLVCVITTFFTMGLSGYSVQKMLERKKKS